MTKSSFHHILRGVCFIKEVCGWIFRPILHSAKFPPRLVKAICGTYTYFWSPEYCISATTDLYFHRAWYLFLLVTLHHCWVAVGINIQWTALDFFSNQQAWNVFGNCIVIIDTGPANHPPQSIETLEKSMKKKVLLILIPISVGRTEWTYWAVLDTI